VVYFVKGLGKIHNKYVGLTAFLKVFSVDSSVPQRSILGPGLFLFYINDFQSRLTSKVRLFADDTIIYITIANEDDASTLQENLNKLGQWENEWCMKFQTDKCNVLRVTNKTKKTEANYHLHGHTLELLTSAKYLGLTITNKLPLYGFNFVYFCFRIRIPNSTGIFNQRANKRLVGLFFNPD
jgi:hypothetical protein